MVTALLHRQPGLILGLLFVGFLVWISGATTAPAPQANAPATPFWESEAKAKRLTVPEISIVDALAAIARGALVIDVRDRDVYEQGHIAGSVSVPLAELKRQAGEFAALTEMEFVIYCGDGSRLGPEGTQALNDAGHPSTKNLAAGYSGWKAAGHPVASGTK